MRLPEDRVLPGPWPEGREQPSSPADAANAPLERDSVRQQRRAVSDPAAITRLAASMVPPRPPAWRRVLSEVQHFWLLVAFLLVWQAVSGFGTRINPQLAVMLPPPPAVFSAAVELANRHALMPQIVD